MKKIQINGLGISKIIFILLLLTSCKKNDVYKDSEFNVSVMLIDERNGYSEVISNPLIIIEESGKVYELESGKVKMKPLADFTIIAKGTDSFGRNYSKLINGTSSRMVNRVHKYQDDFTIYFHSFHEVK